MKFLPHGNSDLKYNIPLAFRDGAIFGGRTLFQIYASRKLCFFNRWLKKLTAIHDPESMSLADVQKFLELKENVNREPERQDLIDNAEEIHVYCLVRDFLREIKSNSQPFITKRTTNVMREFCK